MGMGTIPSFVLEVLDVPSAESVIAVIQERSKNARE
jgi:hypothetical protein